MWLVVGRIGRAHGIRGEVAVEVRTDDPGSRFSRGSRLGTDPAEWGPLTVATARRHSGRLVVRFEGISDRDQAERLRGVTLGVDSAELPESTDPDEFHDHELLGLTVTTTDGHLVGTVTDILHHAQDVLVVTTEAPHRAERMVPFVRALVPHVDVASGTLVIDPPPGLLELE
ncbi:ribosome maturation factor RimM [Lipingzhangella sp. LS1_29]|uniref:Ribosome maturation factor RimM n=1 Tax=Lipingzhangella rawalii TaxID=2055835 RepID=A0ABU2H5P0_9ACTN|nr:ribosome maturation factor RimM [Lipingzhangella rawalii]MDS1270629.1 ribosome maturation factor RimM [Lipingzhangella rawalii]